MLPNATAGGTGSEYKLPRLDSAGLLVASFLGASTTTLYGLYGHAKPTSSVIAFDGSAAVVDLPYGTKGAALLATADAAAARSSLGLDTGDSPTFTNLTLTGGFVVQGSNVAIDAESVLLRANYQNLNVDYVTNTAVTAGIVANYFPTATADTIASGGLVAGSPGSSDITITTTGSDTFANGDIVQLSGSNANDGFYAVYSHSGTTLLLKSNPGVGGHAPTDVFLRSAATTSTTTGIAITKVNISVLRCGTDGIWEVGSGSADGITFVDLATSGYTVSAVKTANYTAVASEHVRCDASGGGFTVTLPAASTCVGKLIEVANEGASGTVTVGRTASDLISGATTDALLASQEVGGYRAIASGVWRRVY